MCGGFLIVGIYSYAVNVATYRANILKLAAVGVKCKEQIIW